MHTWLQKKKKSDEKKKKEKLYLIWNILFEINLPTSVNAKGLK